MVHDDGDPTRRAIDATRPGPGQDAGPDVRPADRRGRRLADRRDLRAGADRRGPGRSDDRDRPRSAPVEAHRRLVRVLERYEAVIGIEVHCQLRTASKMFCGCSTAYDGAPPNTHTCPVCLGLPGALPTINRRAVEHVLATGARDRARRPRARRAGIARTTSTRTCRRATRSASTTCRSPPHGRLTFDDVRRAVHGRRSPGPTSRRTRPSSSTRPTPTAGRVSLVDFNRSGVAAHGDRHRAGHPDRRAGPALRRGAPAAAPRRSARPTRTWSAARCGSRRTCRSGRAARRRSGRGSRSRT